MQSSYLGSFTKENQCIPRLSLVLHDFALRQTMRSRIDRKSIPKTAYPSLPANLAKLFIAGQMMRAQ